MIPYFVMVGIPALMSIFFSLIKFDKEKSDKIVIDLFFLIWLILLLFRDESIGTDLVRYSRHFLNYISVPWSRIIERLFQGYFEIGYVIICKVLGYFTSDFRWVIVACALISVLPIWYLYRNEGKKGFLTIVLFINIAPFAMYFSGLRQAMAMAFVVPCYYFCREKKLDYFLLTVFIAHFFHQSSLVMLLMYPIYHLRLKRQYHILYIIPIVGIIYIFKLPIFSLLITFMGSYSYEYVDTIRVTGAYAVTLLLTVMLIYTFLLADPKRIDYDVVGLRNLMVLSVILQVFSGVHSIAMRMNYYYLLLIPILIPQIMQLGNRRWSFLIKLSVLCMLAFFTFYYFYYAYTDTDILNVYPYVSLFQNLY